MEHIDPGSVSRSVALPPKMWEQIDEVAKDYPSRSSYLRELVASDIVKQEGKPVSSLTQRKKLGIVSHDSDAFEVLAERLVERLIERAEVIEALQKRAQITDAAATSAKEHVESKLKELEKKAAEAKSSRHAH